MDIGDFKEYEEQAGKEAQDKGWAFERVQGDISLLKRLVDGEWDADEFLVVKPWQKIVPVYIDDIVGVEDG